MLKKLGILASVLAVVIAFLTGLLFSLENSHQVKADFFVFSITLPMSVWFFLLLVIGFLIGLLACFSVLMRAHHLQRMLRRSQRVDT